MAECSVEWKEFLSQVLHSASENAAPEESGSSSASESAPAGGKCGALSFQCTAGKDRTGFAAMLVLAMLGVPSDVIMEDYLLSNELQHVSNTTVMDQLGEKLKIDVSNMRHLLYAHPSLLNAAVAAIEAKHGSMLGYITDIKGLGVTPEQLSAFREQMLE